MLIYKFSWYKKLAVSLYQKANTYASNLGKLKWLGSTSRRSSRPKLNVEVNDHWPQLTDPSDKFDKTIRK